MILKKSQVWISAILYMLIATVAMTLVIQAGLPIIQNMRDKSTYSQTEDVLLALDKQIVEVVSEGQGSQRVVPIDLREGELAIVNGVLQWEFETETKIFEPKSKINLGNLIITTNSDVTATELTDYYILENQLIRINVSKFGSSSSWTNYNTSSIINNMEYLTTSKITNGTFNFMIGNDANSATGNGYTKLLEAGDNLAYGTIVAHINSTSFEYDLELTLESDADFLRINVKKLIVK